MEGNNARLVQTMISRLDQRQRLILALRYAEELTVPEIAHVLRIGLAEVQSTLDQLVEEVRREVSEKSLLVS